MNSNLLFDFTVDKETNTVKVTREFDASLKLVWDAWTKSELLDLWWAPKPYQVKTKSQDFKVGGTWLYAMVSPEDEKHWCRADYKEIETLKTLSWLDAFCDEDGNINEDFPRSSWTNSFNENAAKTTVSIVIKHKKLEDLEKIIELGFKEGFTMAMENLDELIQTIKSGKK